MFTVTIAFALGELPSLPAWNEADEALQRMQGTSTTAAAPPVVSAAPPALVATVGEVEEVGEIVEGRGADLSLAQATAFLEGCSDKTKRVLRAMVDSGRREFRLNALAQTLNVDLNDLGGVWGGLTKRTRTILGDKKAKLIAWRNFYDAEYKFLDAAGELSEMTYASFRQALGI